MKRKVVASDVNFRQVRTANTHNSWIDYSYYYGKFKKAFTRTPPRGAQQTSLRIATYDEAMKPLASPPRRKCEIRGERE